MLLSWRGYIDLQEISFLLGSAGRRGEVGGLGGRVAKRARKVVRATKRHK
jgi:hypothetical protein